MVNPARLMKEFVAAGLADAIEGCASDGRIDFRTEATEAQRTQAAAILAAHDPTEPAVPSLEQQVADLRKAIIDMQLGVI